MLVPLLPLPLRLLRLRMPRLLPAEIFRPSPELVSKTTRFDMLGCLMPCHLVGGLSAPAVTAGGRGFLVTGSDSFLNLASALGRSCDIQVCRVVVSRDLYTHSFLSSTTRVRTRLTAVEDSPLARATPRTLSATPSSPKSLRASSSNLGHR